MVATTPRYAAAIACLLAGSSEAFTPSTTRGGVSVVGSAFRVRPGAVSIGSRPLFAEPPQDGPKDGTTITSARKEIGYDAASGRFFETDIDPEDCIPEDEYCVVDKATGELVRLTLEEKERIFLDALQVREFCFILCGGTTISVQLITNTFVLFVEYLINIIIVLLCQWKTTPQRCRV